MEPLTQMQSLIDHADIAIQTLSIMLYAAFAGIIGLFGYIVFQTNNYRKDMQEAWGYVAKLSQAIQGQAADLVTIKTLAEAGNREHKSRGG